MHTVL